MAYVRIIFRDKRSSLLVRKVSDEVKESTLVKHFSGALFLGRLEG